MGYGNYSVTNSVARNSTLKDLTDKVGVYAANSAIFTQKQINNAMSPQGVVVRESRDSADHPNSFAVVLGLDLTGSMGTVPNFLVTEGLPLIMDKVFQTGEKSPQMLFVGVGDHECDGAPLQVGQFESNDELLDKWLKAVYLEGGGGGNGGESYHLAWYFAAKHTSIDCFEKRGRKGLLFTIGDEPVLRTLPKQTLQNLMGEGEYKTYSTPELLEEARKTYDVYHIHVTQTAAGSMRSTVEGWKQLLGDNLLIANNAADIAQIIADTVAKHKVTSAEVTVTTDEEIL